MKDIFLIVIAIVFFSACNPKSADNKPELKLVAQSDKQWTGLAISKKGRLFVNFPRWSEDVGVSVAEIVDGKTIPFPDEKWNDFNTEQISDSTFVCVQSVYVDNENFLWILDPANPFFQGVIKRGPRLYKFNLNSNTLIQTYDFPDSIILPNSYLNDIRVDIEKNIAYITDSGTGGIVVLNLNNRESVKRLQNHASTQAEHDYLQFGEQQLNIKVHSDGIALTSDYQYVYYAALTGYNLYRINTASLSDFNLDDTQMAEQVEKIHSIEATDGMLFADDKTLYLGGIEKNAVYKLDKENNYSLLIKDERIRWADSFAKDADGAVYFTTSQIYLPKESRVKFEIYKIEQ